MGVNKQTYRPFYISATVLAFALIIVFTRNECTPVQLVEHSPQTGSESKTVAPSQSLCAAAPTLPELKGICPPVYSPPDTFKTYLDSFIWTEQGKDGWMFKLHAGIVRGLSKFQHKHCVEGSIGEIGVFMGKYFFAMSSNAFAHEPKLGIDLNIHKRQEIFDRHKENLKVVNITLWNKKSTSVLPEDFSSSGFPAFRLFSVDGDHSYGVTVLDMKLAACTLHSKGVMVVDDFLYGEANWEVDAAVYYFHGAYPDFVPFFIACNKVYLTRRESHAMYLDWVSKQPCVKCSSKHTLMVESSVCHHVGDCDCFQE